MLYILRTLESLGGLICIAGDIQELNSFFKSISFLCSRNVKDEFYWVNVSSWTNKVSPVHQKQNCLKS